MERGYIYLLQSEKEEILYLGSTYDLEKRLLRHNRGRSASTSKNTPWKIIYSKAFDNISDARSVEQKIKRMKKKLSLEWIEECLRNIEQ